MMPGLSTFQVSALAPSALECQHYKADDAVEEDDGSQDDDENHGDGKFAAVNGVGDGQGEVCAVLAWINH